MFTFAGRAVRFCALIGFVCSVIACQQGGRSLNDLEDPSADSVSAIDSSMYPAVVKVISPGGRGLCTGTFIGKRVVLTAAHCTLTEGRYTVATSFGTFYTSDVEYLGEGDVESEDDVALLVFDSDVADPSLGQVVPIGNPVQEGEKVRLVGFGCDNIIARSGSGSKRTGTNEVYEVNNFVRLITPLNNAGARGILGPVNRAGSCFGDSGGPMFREVNGGLELVAIAHAGGADQKYRYTISEYVDLSQSQNTNFIHNVSRVYGVSVGM
jgi:hypothetical protein